MSFSDFQEFFHYVSSSNVDCEFLQQSDFDNIYAAIYAMSNSSGGYVVIGVEANSDTYEIIGADLNFKLDASKLHGLNNLEIQEFLQPARIILIKISPLDFYLKPVILNSKVYRRVEGVNLISSIKSVRYMATRPAENEYNIKFFKRALNLNSVSEFQHEIISHNEKFKIFDTIEFLNRSYILTGHGKFLTQAGYLFLGENSVNVNVILTLDNGEIYKLSAKNLWRAYSDMLPRLISRLSFECANAVKEIFINALIHNDYDLNNSIDVNITNSENNTAPIIKIINSGLAMTLNQNKSYSRNFRLMKIFKLLGAARANGYGNVIIKNFAPDFKLEQDMLNFKSVARIKLQGLKRLPAPVILNNF